MVYELIGLLIIMIISTHVPEKMKFYTRITIVLLMLSVVIHAFEEWTQSFDRLSGWRVFLTATKYLMYPLILISLIDVVSIALRQKSFSLKWILIFCIPELVMIPLCYSSQATGLIFHFIEETNIYTSGPLSKLPYIIFGFYTLLFLVINIIFLKNFSLRNKIIACYIPLGAAISAIIFIIIVDNPDYNPVFTSSLVFYYLFVYIHMANVDTLTGLMNRQSYYNDINTRGNISAVLSIDMNNLKYLNDNYGHDAGDRALATIAGVFVKEAKYHATIYRVGGDEFSIFYYDLKEDEVLERINSMKEELAKTSYTCAFGYAMKEDNLSTKDIINIADMRMYKDKKQMKEESLNAKED